MAGTITRPRAEVMPFYMRLIQAPLYPLTRSGLMSVGILAIVVLLLSYARIGFGGIFAFVTEKGIYWSYVFYIIRQTANGTSRIGVPEFRNFQEDVVMPLVRGIVGTSIVWVPAFIYLLTSDWTFDEIRDLTVLADPVLWLFAAGGIVYAPMALIAAATDVEILGMLNPFQIVNYIRRTGIDYFVAVLGLVLMVPLHWVVGIVGHTVSNAVPIPVLSGWVGEVFQVYPMFVWANVMGLVLYVHGYALDWGDEQLYQEPVLPGVEPRAERVLPAPVPDVRTFEPIAMTPMSEDPFDSREAQTAAARPAADRAIELRAPTPPPSDPFAPPDDVPGVSLELASVALPAVALPRVVARLPDDTPRPLLSEEVLTLDKDDDARPRWSADLADSGVHFPQFLGPAADIKQALSDKNFEAAVERFVTEPAFFVLHMTEAEQFMMGAALAQHRQVPMAIEVLKRIAFSADVIAPKAMFLLARLYTDARKDYDNAERLFRTLMKKFPDSREAAGARAHLSKLGY